MSGIFHEVVEKSNWGYEYTLDGRPLRLKTGDIVNVAWPNGAGTEECRVVVKSWSEPGAHNEGRFTVQRYMIEVYTVHALSINPALTGIAHIPIAGKLIETYPAPVLKGR